MGSQNDTLRMKAFRIPKEAYRDPADDSIPESTQPYLQTVRSSASDAAATVVVRRPQHVDLRLTFQIWGLAAFLVAVMVVLFR